MIRKLVDFFFLSFGIFLPWSLRCRYSEFLLRLESGRFISKVFLHLGENYLRQGKIEPAVENLKLAIDSGPDKASKADARLLLARCYRGSGEDQKSADEIADWYKSEKGRVSRKEL